MPRDRDRRNVVVAPDVAAALASGEPVVALESTILCHGMPHPRNVDTAFRMQDAIRAEGAVPAMIAVLAGRPTAGLTDTEIEQLGVDGQQITKASRRDLPFLVARGEHGATTVAATMIVAASAGIPIFATGGIGGVHRGVGATMDVSADLDELARTDVAVICAGVKSVLDIPRTLEYLETKGVPVAGYRTDTLPAFYTRSSGLPVDYRVDSPAEAAAALRAKWGMGLEGGVVIAAPVPETDALDATEIDAVIDRAIAAVDRLGITGKAITPYLLNRIAEETGGRSLDANVALAINNARIAARIAVEFARLPGSST